MADLNVCLIWFSWLNFILWCAKLMLAIWELILVHAFVWKFPSWFQLAFSQIFLIAGILQASKLQSGFALDYPHFMHNRLIMEEIDVERWLSCGISLRPKIVPYFLEPGGVFLLFSGLSISIFPLLFPSSVNFHFSYFIFPFLSHKHMHNSVITLKHNCRREKRLNSSVHGWTHFNVQTMIYILKCSTRHN